MKNVHVILIVWMVFKVHPLLLLYCVIPIEIILDYQWMGHINRKVYKKAIQMSYDAKSPLRVCEKVEITVSPA